MTSKEREPLRQVSDSMRAHLKKAVDRYVGQGEGHPFFQKRGISEAARLMFQLGVVTTPLPGHEPYQGMIAIPYLLNDGLPVQVRFRCAGEHTGSCKDGGHPKYKTMSGEQSRVFNVGALMGTASDAVHVTEGEADAIILTQLGYTAVGFPGAQQFRPHHAKLLKGYQNIYIWGDPDDAGREFNRIVRSMLPEAKVVPISGYDVNDLYLQDPDGAFIVFDSLIGEAA